MHIQEADSRTLNTLLTLHSMSFSEVVTTSHSHCREKSLWSVPEVADMRVKRKRQARGAGIIEREREGEGGKKKAPTFLLLTPWASVDT